MAYTALELITRAYYLSQVVSRELQVPSGTQITDGLYLLNAIVDFKNSDLREIPYYQEYIFNAVQGQEKYDIPGLLTVDSLTFNIGPVRYAMNEETRTSYFANYRIDNVQSLPFQYRVERTLDGADIYIYFVPADAYVMKLWGKFQLTEVSLNTDLLQFYDPFYVEFLRHELCVWIANEYGATVPDGVMKNYEILQKKIMDVSPADMSIRNLNYFGNSPGLDWQIINLSGGYLPY